MTRFEPTATRARAVTLAFALGLGMSSAMAAPQRAHPFKGTNCQLQAPPEAAHVTDLHGLTVFAHPLPVPATYTGCQTTWLEEDNHVLAVAFYDAGKVVAAWVNEPDKRPYTCRYQGEHLVKKRSHAECPEAATWHSGLFNK
jgi:hypothetical protein